MVKTKKIDNRKFIFLILFICLVYFVPFLVIPQILTHKDNDLGRTYIPIAMFIQKSIFTNSQIPLWRPDQMMGETFVGNPLSSIFYPGNILFLAKNTDLALVIYLFVHVILAAISTYFLARSFNFGQLASFSAAIFYALSIKMLLHLSAGHITMIAAFSYFPLAFLSVRKLHERPSFKWLALGALSVTFMYFTYPTILYYASIFLIIYWLVKSLSPKKNHNFELPKIIKSHLPIILMFMVAFILSSIVIFPQLELAPLSTRSVLKLEDVALPLWNFKRFLTSFFLPYINFDDFDQESLLYLGITPSILAIYGFIYLSKFQKIILTFFGSISLLFVAGTSTPLFEISYRFLPLLKYSRITTRMWFLVILVISLTAALAINRIKNKKIIYIFLTVFIFESFFIGYRKIFKMPNLSFGNETLYQTISQDKDIFRVYCTTHCLNPQLASKYNIQILDGETPIQHLNFIKFLKETGNYQFDRFAVIFPPYQVWQVKNPPVPNPDLVGLANVKYVASTYQIENQDYQLISKFKNIFLYKNNKYKPRFYFENSNEMVEIQKYNPNDISVRFNNSPTPRQLIISENYYPGWFAFIDHQKYQIENQPPIFRKVTIPPNTQNLEVKYQPESYAIGKTLTFTTIVALLLYYWRTNKIKRNGQYRNS